MLKPTKTTFYYNWLIQKILWKELLIVAKNHARGRLIDIGCGVMPYKNLFNKFVSRQIGLDLYNTIHIKQYIDLFGSAYSIPIKDNTFDTAVLTQVLEHLEEPDRAISEVFRILKSPGIAILIAPMYWHVHEEPRDFYRFTKYGLKYIFEKNGFMVLELKPLHGFVVTFGQELVYFTLKFNKFIIIRPLVYLICFFIQIISYFLNNFDKSYDFAGHHIVVAKKKII